MLNLYRYITYALIVFTLTACGSAQPAEAAQKAQSIQFLLSQVRASGVALSGGKVDFYEAGGTTTRKTVWLDRNKATPAANPYTLDSNGTAQLYGDGLYRIVIKDSAGVTKYDRDYISIKEVAGNVYDVADYASLAAAVVSIGSTPATLQFAADMTVSANLVIPSTLELMPLNGAKINHTTYTISYAGSTARWPLAQVLNGTGAVNLPGADVGYPQWFGAVADDSTNNRDAFQQALNACSRVFVPSGVYRTGTIYLNSNNELWGVGNATELKGWDDNTALNPDGTHVSQYILATNAYSMGTADVADNKRNIYVHDMKLNGRVDEFGYHAFIHAMTINATSDMVVERVTFYGMRGDGLYIGSGTTGGIERHNERITVRDCTFDGVIQDNRNGLSVLDCDDLLVDNCKFMRIGSSSGGSASVGAIDFEPDQFWGIYRNIRVVGCSFIDINMTNNAAITLFNAKQTGSRRIRDVSIDKCNFLRCYRGVNISGTIGKTPGSVTDNLSITNSRFMNSSFEDIFIAGYSNTTISNNDFELDPVGSTSYYGGIGVGGIYAGECLNAINTKIFNNTFTGLRPQFGVVYIRGVRGLDLYNNKFINITGKCITLLDTASSGSGRYVEGFRVWSNEARTPDSTVVTAGLFVNSAALVTTDVISSTNFERDNVVLTRGFSKHSSITYVQFNEQSMAGAPSVGTWEIGNKTYLTGAYGGTYTCTANGTFGTLTGVTADTTNGSYTLANVVDSAGVLREGHWITIAGGTTAYKIARINGTSIDLTASYTGATATAAAVAFAVPAFSYSAPTSQSADKGNAAVTLTVNTAPMVNVWSTPLTADRAVTLSTTYAANGAKFRIVRTGAATGAYNLNVGTGPLKALAAGQWCEVEFNGTAWILTAFGSL